MKINKLLEFFQKNHILKSKQPFFELRSGQVEILNNPIDFYVELHRGIKRSTERICFSSLYLGTGNLEKFLAQQLQYSFQRSKFIRGKFLFDFSRGTRLDKNYESSQTVIESIKINNQHNNNIKIGFFKNPLNNRVLGLDDQSGIAEILGVHHIKFYIFDNDVIISGANLAENYFTTRKDRYIVLYNVPELADWLENFQDLLLSNSYLINEDGKLSLKDKRPKPETKEFKEILLQQFNMFQFSNRIENLNENQSCEEFFGLQKEENQDKNVDQENIKQQQEQEVESEKDNEYDLQYYEEKKELQIELQKRKEKATEILENTFSPVEAAIIVRKLDKLMNDEKQRGENLDEGGRVWIFPQIQMPYIQVNQDENLFYDLLEFMKVQQNKQDKLIVSSGYINFPKKLKKILSDFQNLEIITSSPKANSFYKGGKVKGMIPYFYRIYEQSLMKSVLKGKIEGQKIFYEYVKPGWSFHSKGIWWEQENQIKFTLIGSSNYSERSFKRDSELNFYIVNECENFSAELQNEVKLQIQDAEQVDLKTISSDREIKLSFTKKILSKIFQSFM